MYAMDFSRKVMVNGCFDPLHYGHLLHLEAAREMGSFLIVALTEDAFVNKGPGRPVFTQAERGYMLAGLRCVDSVILCKDSVDGMKRVGGKPHVFVKGIEYKGRIAPDIEAYCAEHGIEIAFTDTKKYSSTALLHHYDRPRQS